MSITFGELLEHNGYTIGAKNNVRKKTFREVLAGMPRERLEEIVSGSRSFNQATVQIGFIGSSHNAHILSQALDHWGIDYSHLRIQTRLATKRSSADEGMLPEEVLDHFFSEDPPIKVSWITLLKLIKKHELLPPQCSECGISAKWNGKPMTMQVDHINGNSRDNRIENLRRICPNCHSQTDTYGAKNRSTTHISALIDAKKV
jgi:5-methylcytosine-specific restriction endonuclease McrA